MNKTYLTAFVILFSCAEFHAQCTANAGNDTTICRDSRGFDTTYLGANSPASGGVPPYQYSWSAGPISIEKGFHKAEWLLSDTASSHPRLFEHDEKRLDFILTVTDSTGATCKDTVVTEFCGIPPFLSPPETEVLAKIEIGDSVILGTDSFRSEPLPPPHDFYCGKKTFVRWYFNSGSIQNPQEYNTVLYPDSSGYLWSEIMDEAGCVHKYHEYSILAYPVGIDEKPIDEKTVRVFPNPIGSSEVNISTSVKLNGQLQVFNNTGSLVSEQNINMEQGETLQISTRDWPRGLYMIRIKSGDKIETHRAVK